MKVKLTTRSTKIYENGYIETSSESQYYDEVTNYLSSTNARHRTLSIELGDRVLTEFDPVGSEVDLGWYITNRHHSQIKWRKLMGRKK